MLSLGLLAVKLKHLCEGKSGALLYLSAASGYEWKRSFYMNATQRSFVEIFFAVLGVGSLLVGVFLLILFYLEIGRVDYLFDLDQFALIVWPPFVFGAILLWVRNFFSSADKCE